MNQPVSDERSELRKDDYQARVREQIEQYQPDSPIHELPGIFHEWSHRFVRPALRAVFDCDSITDFYACGFLECARAEPGPIQFLSVGCGDGTTEIDVAKRLLDLGLAEFRFVCMDLSPTLLARFAERIPSNLSHCFTLIEGDVNRYRFDERFHGIMANHSLHHMVALEDIFATLHAVLHDRGAFLTSDMIGRNGHQRWPETRFFVDYFWPMLTKAQRYNSQLRRPELRFLDHDCSTSGFEGIRAQDILALILATGFRAHSFAGLGGFIDPFVDRGFGHNFSTRSPDDLFLIRRLGLLNEALLDSGVIKPTIMFARFVKHDAVETAYRGRTAARCVRDPGQTPAWLDQALADFAALGDDPEFVFRATQNRAGVVHQTRDAERDVEMLEDQLREKRQRLTETEAENAALAAQIAAYRSSTSWRLTAPLRWVVDRARKLPSAGRGASAA